MYFKESEEIRSHRIRENSGICLEITIYLNFMISYEAALTIIREKLTSSAQIVQQYNYVDKVSYIIDNIHKKIG